MPVAVGLSKCNGKKNRPKPGIFPVMAIGLEIGSLKTGHPGTGIRILNRGPVTSMHSYFYENALLQFQMPQLQFDRVRAREAALSRTM
jgi:hypothetical protein